MEKTSNFNQTLGGDNSLNIIEDQIMPTIKKIIKILEVDYELMVEITMKRFITITLIKLGTFSRYQTLIEISTAMMSRPSLEFLGFTFPELLSSIIEDNNFEINELIPEKEFQLNFIVELKVINKSVKEKFTYVLNKLQETININEIDNNLYNCDINNNPDNNRLNSIETKLNVLISKFESFELNYSLNYNKECLTERDKELALKDKELDYMRREAQIKEEEFKKQIQILIQEKEIEKIKREELEVIELQLRDQILQEKQSCQQKDKQIKNLLDEIDALNNDKSQLFIEKEEVSSKLQKKLKEYNSMKSLEEQIKKFRSYHQVKYIKIETNDGNESIDDLNNFTDRSLKNGITTAHKIILELDREVEFEEVEVGCYKGDSNWGPTYLNGAMILTSKDKSKWTTVGSVGQKTGTVSQVKVNKSSAKFVKIDIGSGNLLGVGYFKVINLS